MQTLASSHESFIFQNSCAWHHLSFKFSSEGCILEIQLWKQYCDVFQANVPLTISSNKKYVLQGNNLLNNVKIDREKE